MKTFKQYLKEQTTPNINEYDNQASIKLGQLLYICTIYLDKLTDNIDNLNEKDQLSDNQQEKLELYETLHENLTIMIGAIQRLGYIQPIQTKTGSLNNISYVLNDYDGYITNLIDIISPTPQNDTTVISRDDALKQFFLKKSEARVKSQELKKEIQSIVDKHGLTIDKDGVGWHAGDKAYIITFKGDVITDRFNNGGYGSKIDNEFNTPPMHRVSVSMSQLEAYEEALKFLKTTLGIVQPKIIPENPKDSLVEILNILSDTMTDIENSL